MKATKHISIGLALLISIMFTGCGKTSNTEANDVAKLEQEQADLQINAPSQAVSIVLCNLLRNACNYTEKGTVVVTIRASSVSISDSGEGIAKEEIERIQQPFERSSDQQGGYGLGLDIVRRLCQRFDWRLGIYSEVNKGTTVTVTFIR